MFFLEMYLIQIYLTDMLKDKKKRGQLIDDDFKI
jgi:hypothetical protein